MYRMVAIAASAIALIIAMCCVLVGAGNAEASSIFTTSNFTFDSIQEPEYVPELEVEEPEEIKTETNLSETRSVEKTSYQDTEEEIDEDIESSPYVNAEGTYPGNFKRNGEIYSGGLRYTWYSERVLPGGGLHSLNSNGRHTDENGFVCDGDGYIALASNDYPKGYVIETPFGTGKVYDCGCPSGTVDVYVNW